MKLLTSDPLHLSLRLSRTMNLALPRVMLSELGLWRKEGPPPVGQQGGCSVVRTSLSWKVWFKFQLCSCQLGLGNHFPFPSFGALIFWKCLPYVIVERALGKLSVASPKDLSSYFITVVLSSMATACDTWKSPYPMKMV